MWSEVALTNPLIKGTTGCPDPRGPEQHPYSKCPLPFRKLASSFESWLPHLKSEAVELELTSMVTEWSSSLHPPTPRALFSDHGGTQAQVTSGPTSPLLLKERSAQPGASSRVPLQGLPLRWARPTCTVLSGAEKSFSFSFPF